MQVNMHEAKSQLSALGETAWQGVRVIVTKAGKPYLEILPHQEQQVPRRPGRWQGRIQMAADFDPTTGDVIADFEDT
jgi:antitoxin (DNA-binding transcriptional repressor) of toxin-antitoxin stability system